MNKLSLETQLFDILRQVQQSNINVSPRKAEFRVSSLPFCPILYVISAKNPETTVKFDSSFYFAIGHSLHTLWQNAISEKFPRKVVGDWKCSHILKFSEKKNTNIIRRCSHMVKFDTLTGAQKRNVCPHGLDIAQCNAKLRYEELNLQLGKLTGHTDLLLKIKSKYHLLDFKNTSNFLFDKPDIAARYNFPNPKYLHQLETYVVMLEKQYKIKIDSYTVVYISRERATHAPKKPALKLFTRKVDNKLRAKQRGLIKTYQNQHKISQAWLDRKANTKKLWESRPCLSMRDYLNKMKPTFFKDCNELEDCRSGELKNRLQKMRKT